MKRLIGIITTPGNLGQALADYRTMLGITRRQLADTIAAATGRPTQSVYGQITSWEDGLRDPQSGTLGPILDALGCDLALIPRDDA